VETDIGAASKCDKKRMTEELCKHGVFHPQEPTFPIVQNDSQLMTAVSPLTLKRVRGMTIHRPDPAMTGNHGPQWMPPSPGSLAST
jgi:hypothetical protein